MTVGRTKSGKSLIRCVLMTGFHMVAESSICYNVYGFFPKCLFPDLIVWYFLMGARFLFNTFLMHVSHQDKMISSSSYISKPINVACAVRF